MIGLLDHKPPINHPLLLNSRQGTYTLPQMAYLAPSNSSIGMPPVHIMLCFAQGHMANIHCLARHTYVILALSTTAVHTHLPQLLLCTLRIHKAKVENGPETQKKL